MKSKIVEWIRQVLRRVVLPFRKNKEELLSKFRFSMEFRISLHYFKLLIINGIVFMFIFLGMYIGVEVHNYEKLADSNIWQIVSGNVKLSEQVSDSERDIIVYGYKDEADLNSYYVIDEMEAVRAYIESVNREKINPYYRSGVGMRITDANSGEVIYDDIKEELSGKKLWFHKYYIDDKNEETPLASIYKNSFEVGDEKYLAYFQFNMTEDYKRMKQLLLGIILAYLIIVAFIIQFGRKGILKMFKPISDMSKSTNHLTVNNLHSERLNVEGTKNELKDLATTINSMLDRIEISYESQKQFVSDASHELRTPIAVIQGYANLLNRWGKKDEQVMEESIEAIQNEAKAMQDLVEKLLFLSRHDKKTLKLVKTRFNMCEVVEDMVKETKLVVSNREITSPVLEDVIVYGDKQALKQAVRIFIDNAVKYTRDNDKITITCRNDKGDCIVCVEDTGIGMTRKDINNIFERFYRSDNVRDQKISGHGLGLSIAKLIIMKHTGSIRVRSQYTKGSSFTIILPKREMP